MQATTLSNLAHHTQAALANPAGVYLNESIEVALPAPEVYRFWRRLEHLPSFMTHVDRVTEGPDGLSHWVVEGLAGLTVEWDVEIVDELKDKRITWRSVPGSNVDTAGSVRFDAISPGRTRISATLQCAPPAGSRGALITWLFGHHPAETLRDDLRRLKQILEEH